MEAGDGKWQKIHSSPSVQNGRHFIFKCIFMNEKLYILIRISLNFVPKGPIDNNTALVQVMAWHWSGNKALSKPIMTQFSTEWMHP